MMLDYSFLSRKFKQALGYVSLWLSGCNDKSPYKYMCIVHHKDYCHSEFIYKFYFENLKDCKEAAEYLSKYPNTYCELDYRS